MAQNQREWKGIVSNTKRKSQPCKRKIHPPEAEKTAGERTEGRYEEINVENNVV